MKRDFILTECGLGKCIYCASLQLDTINAAIYQLGERVVDELSDFRHVNRVYIVGGGALLIEPAVKAAWHHLGSKVVMMASPQIALVQAIAAFKGK